jgi:hypothetical protein
MKTSELTCWKCGTSLADLLLPVSRLAKCKSCNADLHVCRLCRFYDTTVSNSCTEPVAEKVVDKQRRNFCGFFQPNPQVRHKPANVGTEAARSQLDALFGIGPDMNSPQEGLTAEEDARRKLAALFDLKPDEK